MKQISYMIIIVFSIISCSNNDKEVAYLVNDKINTMSGHEVVRDLLIENDGDEEQLARIFKCSVPTINRIINKETYLTDNALSEFRNLLVAVKVSGEDTFKENDPYYESWIRSFRYWLNNWIWIGGGILFLSGLLVFLTNDNQVSSEGIDVLSKFVFMPLMFLFGGGYLITWIFNMIWSYEEPANLFLQKINPILETLL